jgi:hypothetical protein
LDVYDRVYYYFVNPLSGKKYHDVLLRIFFGIPHHKILAGDEFYPIDWDSWLELYAEDDFRAICHIDMPIIKDELLKQWHFILEGDFSFEEDYVKWKIWYEKAKLVEKDWRQLSYAHYLKGLDNLNMYIIEGYPEFEFDVEELFVSPIEAATGLSFSIDRKNDYELLIVSEKCSIHLFISSGQSAYFKLINPNWMIQFDEVLLRIFFGKEFTRRIVGGADYPITMKQWVDYYAADDFRSICRIDLPIIKDELLEDWRFILEGDFSFEDDYAKWEIWYEKAKLVEKDGRQLSYAHYLKEQEGIG